MYFLTEKASRARQREAQRARDNRAEIVKALSHGQITRRDLYKWGIFTVTGSARPEERPQSVRAERLRGWMAVCRPARRAARCSARGSSPR